MKRLFSVTIILAICLCGCCQESSIPGKEETTEPGLVDYITGAEQIKAYERAKSKIEEINRTLEERQQEIE